MNISVARGSGESRVAAERLEPTRGPRVSERYPMRRSLRLRVEAKSRTPGFKERETPCLPSRGSSAGMYGGTDSEA
jgi:hypothetical protein